MTLAAGGSPIGRRPFIVLLGVPLAVLGALAAQWSRGLANDVYCQVGVPLLRS